MILLSYPEELVTTSFLPVKVKCFYNLPKKSNTAIRISTVVQSLGEALKHLTRFLASTGTPETLVERRSLDFDGDNENLIVSPKLIT